MITFEMLLWFTFRLVLLIIAFCSGYWLARCDNKKETSELKDRIEWLKSYQPNRRSEGSIECGND